MSQHSDWWRNMIVVLIFVEEERNKEVKKSYNPVSIGIQSLELRDQKRLIYFFVLLTVWSWCTVNIVDETEVRRSENSERGVNELISIAEFFKNWKCIEDREVAYKRTLFPFFVNQKKLREKGNRLPDEFYQRNIFIEKKARGLKKKQINGWIMYKQSLSIYLKFIHFMTHK